MRVVASAALALLTGCMANLRPEGLPEDRPPVAAEIRGRQILAELRAAHGGPAWDDAKTLSLVLTDEWRTLLGRLGNPWPEAKVKVRLQMKVGTFDARSEFLAGEQAGTIWGLQSWRAYTERPGEAVVFAEDGDISFMLPALQYLVELPARISDAELVAYAGEAEVAGRLQDVVFATWGRLEGHSEDDQYRIFVDRETRRLTSAHYTVRDFADIAQGVAHYDAYREVGGLLLAHRIRVTSSTDAPKEDWIHEVKVESAQVNAAPTSLFVADPDLPEAGDIKPAR